jgi:amino-acid N-acetyltransferase
MKKRAATIIRHAGFEDAGAIYTSIKDHPREVVPRSISDIVQNIDRFLVCVVKGRIVGTAAWQVLPEIGRAAHPSIEIKSVTVARNVQRKGIGTAMVKAVIRRVKSFHPAQIVVLTFSPDYFRRFGFRQVPKETLMHKLYMGCINCTKYDSPFTCPEVAMTLAVKPRKG